ncbi:MAG: Type 2 DNA topoisomerase 6 subunit B [Phycisphaerae bacterium]|nr:Type 2 DNA topoisomerase 6 subunit B [Phycisphaerae bacterium]
MSKKASPARKGKSKSKSPRKALQAESAPPPKPPAPPRARKSAAPETAESMAVQQKEIAVSEFFAKNRHLLGFDNPRKALLTCVKEAVDNSLDACEEGGILPEIWVIIEPANGNGSAAGGEAKKTADAPLTGLASGKGGAKEETQPSLLETVHPEIAQSVSTSLANVTRFRVTVRDNGPGIVKAQIPNIFGRLLYGSKFHRLRMSRGQQGIGISAAGMYGLLTTGQSVEIISRTGRKKPAHRFELQMDTRKNRAEIIKDQELANWPRFTVSDADAAPAEPEEVEHGTEVRIVLEARFQRGRASVDEYMEQTAIANPHAEIHYIAPDGARRDFPREVNEVPASPAAIKPHPYGVELGVLIRMLKETKHKHLGGFLQKEFSRVSLKVAQEICAKAGLTTLTWCSQVVRDQADRLHAAIQGTKIMAPPTNCLVPIGPQQILKGLLKEIKAEFCCAATRDPAVYRGNPFQIEVGLAYGGQLPADDSARVIRFANRVPLLYQPSACAITKSVVDVGWRNYALSQPRNSGPEGPLVIFVHMASVWVPFTSESKEAVAGYDEIAREIKLALQECGRKLSLYIRRRQHAAREGQRRHVFERYIGEVVNACGKMIRVNRKQLYAELQAVAKRRTAKADERFDENGNPIRPGRDELAADANVVVIESNAPEADADAVVPAAVPDADKPKAGRKGAAAKKSRAARGLFDENEGQ